MRLVIYSQRRILKTFFELNGGSTDTKAIKWDASKAYNMAKLLRQPSKTEKEDMKRMKELEAEI